MGGWEGDAEHSLLALLLDSITDTQSHRMRMKYRSWRGNTSAEQQLTQLIEFIFHVDRSANCQLFQTNSSMRCLHVDN